MVDGDTVAVTIGGREEKLRLSHLDTEESSHGSDKPVTPWGKKAKERAIELLPPGAAVTLEFAGTELLESAWSATGTTSAACWSGSTMTTRTSRSA